MSWRLRKESMALDKISRGQQRVFMALDKISWGQLRMSLDLDKISWGQCVSKESALEILVRVKLWVLD